MSKLWSPLIRDIEPYVPGEQPKGGPIIKLNTNENPYPPSPAVAAALDGCSLDSLRLYPDPEASALKAAIAVNHGVQAEQVFVGNGSDEVLGLAFMAFFKQVWPILFPDFTYSFYPVYCNLFDIEYRNLPLTAEFRVNVEDYAQANGGIVLANPNAPTGVALPLSDVQTLVRNSPDSVVIIDEAYVDFGAESAASLVDQYPNLLVVQTFSKSRSLAGLRIGYALGNQQLIEGLERVKNSFNSYPLDRLAIAAGVASMQDTEYFEQTCQSIIASRDRLTRGLLELGFDVLPSATNFVFAKPAQPAAEVYQKLRQQGILVRYFAKPGISDYLRITVGTDAECDALLAALKAIA